MTSPARHDTVVAPSGRRARGPSGLRSLQPRLAELAERVTQVDLRDFETAPAAEIAVEPRASVSRLVKEARALVAAVLGVCERARVAGAALAAAAQGPQVRFEHALDAAVESLGTSIEAVEDVAFLVQLELRQRGDRLVGVVGAQDVLTIIGDCDSALRAIRKGLGALDLAIARFEGVVPLLDFSSELQDSLLVRGAYTKLRARLLAEGTPASTELHARMRAAGTHIAVLVGWTAYPLLRVRDRLQLRELQRRILTWLRAERRSERAGLDLWRDLVAFVRMLSQVSRRQELVEHDSRLVRELLASLPQGAEPVDAETRARLKVLEGLDDRLDRVLASGASLSARVLRDLLEHVAVRLGAPCKAVP